VVVVTGGLLETLLKTGDFAGISPGYRGDEAVATGFAPLDRLLPAGGVRRGSLVEWLADAEASGAAALAAAVACRLAGRAEQAAEAAATIIVVDRTGRFHPPAMLSWLERAGAGGRLAPRLVVARPAHEADELWAIDQALRCRGVAAVLAWPRSIHSTAMRRWQLAARASLAVGLFVRPLAARREPSWAEARVAVTARPCAGCGSHSRVGRGPARRICRSGRSSSASIWRVAARPCSRRGQLCHPFTNRSASHAAHHDDLAAAMARATPARRAARAALGAGVCLSPGAARRDDDRGVGLGAAATGQIDPR
jgi:protein ImuA